MFACVYVCYHVLKCIYFIQRSEQSEKHEISKASSLEEVLQDSRIWNPGSFVCHNEWISSLTTAIISSGAVKDEVLKCLAPLCEVNVSVVIYMLSVEEVERADWC